MKFIVTFRSRINAMRFYDEMTRRGEDACLVSNRRQCGLAVKVDCFDTARHILDIERFSSFCSIYEVIGEKEYKLY